MKLTLETDDGRKNTVTMEGEPDDRLEALQGMCKMLDLMAGKTSEEGK
jgi:hypothetical protein